MSTAFAGVGLVDLAMLAVILLSVVVGLVRGLIFEVLSLAGWVVAYLVASWFAADAQAWLPMLQRF
ncbi:MAG: CvpA family protein, partial [Rhodoferax sp.]|nr:CvpA family protein [Rhodoferax sp.]